MFFSLLVLTLYFPVVFNIGKPSTIWSSAIIHLCFVLMQPSLPPCIHVQLRNYWEKTALMENTPSHYCFKNTIFEANVTKHYFYIFPFTQFSSPGEDSWRTLLAEWYRGTDAIKQEEILLSMSNMEQIYLHYCSMVQNHRIPRWGKEDWNMLLQSLQEERGMQRRKEGFMSFLWNESGYFQEEARAICETFTFLHFCSWGCLLFWRLR